MIIRKDVASLAVPIITEQAFVKIMGVLNAVMAGHLGKEAVSAIGMVDAINNIFISLFSAMALGGSVVVAHYAGRKDIKSLNEAARHATYSGGLIALAMTLIIFIFKYGIISILYGSAEKLVMDNLYIYLNITLLTYPLIALTAIACGVLRGAGNTKAPMKVNIIMNIINVVFSFLLINGVDFKFKSASISIPGLGITGAALGIAIARTVGSIMVLYILVRGSGELRLRIERDFKINKDLLRSIYGVGIPAGVESLLFNGGKLITQVLIVGMGTTAIAANYIATSIGGLITIPAESLSMSATVLAGQYMGRGDGEGAKSTLLYLLKLSSVCMAIIGVVAFPFTTLMAKAYTENADVIKGVVLLLNFQLIVLPILHPASFTLSAGLKGTGDAKYTMKVSIFGMWAFRIVLGYILGVMLKIGVLGVWLGAYVDWLVRGILFYIRLQKGNWKNNVVIKNSSGATSKA